MRVASTLTTSMAQVSIIGAGMKTHPGVTATMFEVLAKENINIEMISTSPIRISCTVRADAVDDAVRSFTRPSSSALTSPTSRHH